MEFIIDGLYNDWEKIDSIITQENSKLRELKLYKDDKYLYVCVIGNNLNKFQNTQLLINADNNTQTGYIATNHGIDYLIENGELFKYTKEKGVDWSFSRIGSIEGYKKTDTCIEYKIGLENINTLNNIIALKVRVLDNNIYSIQSAPVKGHIKLGKYVSAHLHLDVLYIMEADDTIPLVYREDESKGVKWIPLEEADNETMCDFIRPIHKKLIKKLNDR